jgi:hypothetical protein
MWLRQKGIELTITPKEFDIAAQGRERSERTLGNGERKLDEP